MKSQALSAGPNNIRCNNESVCYRKQKIIKLNIYWIKENYNPIKWKLLNNKKMDIHKTILSKKKQTKHAGGVNT